MKKVLLRFYSANNLGDDLFIKIITERYKNNFSLIAHDNVDLFKTTSNLRVYRNRWISFATHRIGKAFGKIHLWLQLLAKKHDLLVYIGGSIFIENNNLGMWRQEKEFYSRLKLPYYILGSNFGPFKTQEFKDIAKAIFQGAKDVCLRDRASYSLFDKIRTVRVATDVAFTLDRSKYNLKNEKMAIFSIVDCSNRFDQEVSSKYEREIAALSAKLLEEGFRVVYMSFCTTEGDMAAAEKIRARLETHALNHKLELFNYDGNLEEGLSLLAQSQIVVGTRFHAIILGLLFSKKVLPFAYSKKTLNILEDIKFKGQIVDINNISSFNGEDFDFKKLQINDVSKQVELAQLQFQELDKILVKK